MAETPKGWPESDVQCARCGSSLSVETCEQCGGDGVYGHDCGEDCCNCLHPEENVPCESCDGDGVWYRCLSSADWCIAHPLPGRERVARSEPEWFTVPQRAGEGAA